MKKLILSAVLASVLVSPAFANEEGVSNERREKMKQHFMQMDADKDGKISKPEFLAGADARFEKMDANSDGFLTKEDREMYQKKHKNQQE